jgi:hypothetical protein
MRSSCLVAINVIVRKVSKLSDKTGYWRQYFSPIISLYKCWRERGLLDSLAKYKGTVRLSNKSDMGYWWCYLTPADPEQNTVIVAQANNPKEAITKALEQANGNAINKSASVHRQSVKG